MTSTTRQICCINAASFADRAKASRHTGSHRSVLRWVGANPGLGAGRARR
ncbi:hypothetical protein [Roseococcus thiosulfatophilus]|nr:hypothetical protein [Roseococcus thiosulfatophilus]